MRSVPASRIVSADRAFGNGRDLGSGQAAPPAVFPGWLLAGYLLFQLLVLAWTAYPARTMRQDQPLESWLFLAGGQALFLSWIWPIFTLGRGACQRPTQAVVDAALLALAGVAPAVAAIWWVDASGGQVSAPAVYLVLWLIAGVVFLRCAIRAGELAGIIRWAYPPLVTLANFGLLGLGYLSEEFLGGSAWPWQRLSPMCLAAHLAEAGWPTDPADKFALVIPLAMALGIAFVASLPGRRPGPRHLTLDP